MERKILVIVFSFFLLINLYPFLHGYRSAPSNTVFLGTVHYPIDYLYYLSNITQGYDHFLLTTYLTTTEPLPDMLIAVPYVLLGNIGAIFRISPIIMYQVGLLSASFLFLLGAYLLIRQLFPDRTDKRILTFLFFMFSNTLPRIVVENGKTILAPYFSWYNYGEPFLRFSAVPHHLLIQATLFFTVLSIIVYHRSHEKKKKVWLGVTAICSLILANMQPVQWIVLSSTSGLLLSILFVIHSVITRTTLSIQLFHRFIRHMLPNVVFVVFGIPMMVYMKMVISREPFVSTNLWEAAQSPILLQWQFIQYHGIVFLISILGIPFFLNTRNTARFFVALVTGTSVAIFLHPMSRTLPILTFRYLSSLPILFYAACTTHCIFMISNIARRFDPFVKSICITLLFFFLIPLFFVQLSTKSALLTPSGYLDPTIFVNREIYHLFLEARTISTKQDIFIAYHPYQSIFQAVAARRQYVVSQFSTIEYNRKSEEIYQLLDTSKPTEVHMEFLKKNSIDYIIASNTEQISVYPFLTKVKQNQYMTIYKVHI